MPFAHSFRVRYAECDPQGVVFNAHYLAYLDTSITELWREAVGGYQSMIDRGLDMVVVETTLRFHQPAGFDDLLTLEVEISRLGNTSISSTHRITRDDELVLEASLHHVLVDLKNRSKTPIPDWIRSGLAPWTQAA
ncbi:MAG TPA: thioesterase family protein [Solirubrobacteraceae bacterium]